MSERMVFLVGATAEETTHVGTIFRAFAGSFTLYPLTLEAAAESQPAARPAALWIVRCSEETASTLYTLLAPVLERPFPPVIVLVDAFTPETVTEWMNRGAWRVLPLANLAALLPACLAALDGRDELQGAAAAHQAHYRLISEAAHDLIFLISRDGLIQYANPAACAAAQVDPQQAEEMPVGQFFPKAFAANQMRMFYEMHEMNRPIYTENAFALSEATETWFGTWLVPIHNERRQIVSMLGIARDITEEHARRLELEESLKNEHSLAEVRSSFFSMTTHQFRTPLSSILLSVEVLRKYNQQLTPQKRMEQLERIEEAAKRLNSMLEDILVISRVDAGRYMVYPKDFNLITFVDETLNEMQINDRRAHTLVYEHDLPNIPVRLDPDVLHRVVDNLLSNALKYSPAGTTVTVQVWLEDEMVVLQVSDQGIGIPESDLTMLFQPFQRGSNAASFPGTGIGLTIIQKSVELLKGTLTLKSEVGRGTTFQVRFPVRISSNDSILV